MAAFRRSGNLRTVTWNCESMTDWVREMISLFSSETSWEPGNVDRSWRHILQDPQSKLEKRDRISDLPELNGRRKDGNPRYLGQTYSAGTVPQRRALESLAPAQSTTVVRVTQHALAQATLSSYQREPASVPRTREVPLESRVPTSTARQSDPRATEYNPRRSGRLHKNRNDHASANNTGDAEGVAYVNRKVRRRREEPRDTDLVAPNAKKRNVPGPSN